MKEVLRFVLLIVIAWMVVDIFFTEKSQPPIAQERQIVYVTEQPKSIQRSQRQQAQAALPSLFHSDAASVDFSKGPEIGYCFVGDWTETQKSEVASGLARWNPAGISFYDGTNRNDCETYIRWANLNGPEEGRGSVGLHFIDLSPSTCRLDELVSHEMGHNLGLDDRPIDYNGVMNDHCPFPYPNDNELKSVYEMWVK